jgi:hypothetical protein
MPKLQKKKILTYVDSIHSGELEIKDTLESCTFALYLDILLKIDAGGKRTTQLHDKQYDLDFAIISLQYMYICTCSNISISPVYGICISTDSI